ncbi:MAG: hypothetical protein ABSA03_01200 [Streptosporangiaceae bacterium]|jgi:hypothetical protein
MNWFWLNIPLATVIFLAMSLIPLWLVIKRPDARTHASGPSRRVIGRPAAVAIPVPVESAALAAARLETAGAGRAGRQLDLVGSSRR